MDEAFRKNVQDLFYRCTQIERDQIFGEKDPMPINAFRQNATLMWPGVVGPSYKPGGLLMLAINPGGGQDKYTDQGGGEDELYGVMRRLKDCTPEHLEHVFTEYTEISLRVQRDWSLWMLMYEVLIHTDTPFDAYANMNAVPYRTKDNKSPGVKAVRRAWQKIVNPQIDLLKPGVIAALGKKAGDVLKKHYTGDAKIFILPRTNGDRYIHQEAEDELLRMSLYFRCGRVPGTQADHSNDP